MSDLLERIAISRTFEAMKGAHARHPDPPAGWPSVVPILTGDDFCRGRYGEGRIPQYSVRPREYRRCIVGWWFWCFEAAESFPPSLTESVLNGAGAMSFNDSSDLGEVAAAWNRYVESIGYTIPCEGTS